MVSGLRHHISYSSSRTLGESEMCSNGIANEPAVRYFMRSTYGRGPFCHCKPQEDRWPAGRHRPRSPLAAGQSHPTDDRRAGLERNLCVPVSLS